MDPLAKGKIVGKCQLCSEPWDKSDLEYSEVKGYCPYCGYDPGSDTYETP